MRIEIHSRLRDIPPRQWNALKGTETPFLRHEFLSGLEEYDCVCDATGWIPQHVGVYRGDRLIAAAPLYLKTHSWGEFVFDWSWADAFERHGLEYYPKLISAVPYTPATGPRVLVHPDEDGDALVGKVAEAGRILVSDNDLSSLHWLFTDASQTKLIADGGYAARWGYQYHWRNEGYRDFGEFLAAMSSKKRKNVLRERRRVTEAGIRFDVRHGPDITHDDWHRFHAFYARTFRLHGNIPPLSLPLFEYLGQSLGSRVVLIRALLDDRLIATALCFRSDDTLFGRYWGCAEDFDGLHFETCYYQGIDYCIANGLGLFEPGAQGQHKLARGFLPSPTYSCHWIPDRRLRAAIDDVLRREQSMIKKDMEVLRGHSPFKAGS